IAPHIRVRHVCTICLCDSREGAISRTSPRTARAVCGGVGSGLCVGALAGAPPSSIIFVASLADARYPRAVSKPGWLVAALAAVVIVVAFPLVRWRPGRSVELGPLEVTPPAKQLSVRVGESVQFSAGAQGALG